MYLVSNPLAHTHFLTNQTDEIYDHILQDSFNLAQHLQLKKMS